MIEWQSHSFSPHKTGGSIIFLVRCVSNTRSSSGEVRIQVPFFLQSILVGEPSPKKETVKVGT